MKKIGILVFFIILFSCSKENRVAKILENCADVSISSNYLSYYPYKNFIVNKIKTVNREISNLQKRRSNLQANYTALNSQFLTYKDVGNQEALQVLKKIPLFKKSYKNMTLNRIKSTDTSFPLELYKQLNRRKYTSKYDIEKIKRRTRYFSNYSQTLKDFKFQLASIRQSQAYAKNKMNSLRIERASWYDTKSTKVQKYKKLEKKYYKKAYEKAQKFKRLSRKKKLQSSWYSRKYQRCETIRARSPIAFDEKWK